MLKRVACSIRDLDADIGRWQKQATQDKLTARVLKEAGFDRCFTCNMPVLDPDDADFDAKVEAIEGVAQGLQTCTDRCCRKRQCVAQP